MVNDILLREMGAKIKAQRQRCKMSLPKLAELTKVDMSNLWFVENGRRNVHILTLKSIADALGVDMKDFL